MNSQTKTNPETQVPYDVKHLHDLLEQQKIAYLRHPVPTAKERIDRLARLKRVLFRFIKIVLSDFNYKARLAFLTVLNPCYYLPRFINP